MRDLTGGRGVELVIDAVGGSSFAKSFRALAPTGRLGMFGLSAAAPGKKRSRLALLAAAARTPFLAFHPMRLMDQNKGVFGVNLGHLWDEVDRITGWLEAILGRLGEGAVRPVVDRSFPFDEAAAAHHYLQDRKNFGKVVLTP